MKLNNKDIYEFWEIHKELTLDEKTQLFNKTYGTKVVPRTLNERYKNFKQGLEYGKDENILEKEKELLAKREFNVLKTQKKNTLIKREAHKIARDIGQKELLLDAIKVAVKEQLPKKADIKTVKKSTNRVIDIVISDPQYKGDEHEWIRNIFHKLDLSLEKWRKSDVPTEFRFTFLGDDVEAAHAHESQLAENNTDTITQTIQLSKLYVEGIDLLSKDIDTKKHNKSLVFVPYSNHGMIGGYGKGRYQRPNEDLGRIIFEWIKGNIDKDIKVYDVDKERFVIETKDTVYLHGHQGYVKNKQRFLEIVGTKKDIYMGHLHHLIVNEEMHRDVIVFPTCRKDLQDYERLAGFNPKQQVTITIREKGRKIIERIEL